MEENVSIGTLLRSARENKKIKLEDIANKTKININVLKALEEDDVASLPNIAYLKGFVRNYAKAVGVNEHDADECLRQTLQIKDKKIKPAIETIEITTETQEFEEQELKENLISIIQSFFNKKIIAALVALAIVILILKTLVNWFADLNFESNKIAEMDKQNIQQATPVLKDQDANILEMDANKKFAQTVSEENQSSNDNQQAATTTEKADETKKLAELKAAEAKKLAEQKAAEAKKLAEQKAKEEEEKKAEEQRKAAEAKKLAEQKAKEEEKKVVKRTDGKLPFRTFSPAPAQTFSIVKDSPESQDAELLPPNFKAAVEADKENVFIHATDDDSWISYKADDGPIKRFVLKKGRKVLIKGKVIRLFMGNYRVAKIFYNNDLIEVRPTKSGVRSIIFPQSAAKDFKLPLFPVYQGKSYTPEEYIENMAPENSQESN